MKQLKFCLSLCLILSLTSCKKIVPICRTADIEIVTICKQLWAQKNLNVSTYRNGDAIPQVSDSIEWNNLTTGAWCYYNNDSTNGPVYGKLYNWYAVHDPRGLAPDGWHVPSDEEWKDLINCLGGFDAAGLKLRDTALWLYPNNGMALTNSSSFTAVPAGYRMDNGTLPGHFNGLGYYGMWWTSTDTTVAPSQVNGITYTLFYTDAYVGRYDQTSKVGLSVRLVSRLECN